MKITKIQPAVKTKGRYNIFLDGKYSFSLSEDQLLQAGLKVDQKISESELESFKQESAFGKAYARALDLIARRPRSEKEIREYARRKKWEPEWTEKIVSKLQERNYLNDEAFARMWVNSRAHLKNISKKKLRLELLQKGVSNEIIDGAIEQSGEYDEADSLRRLVKKKRARYDNHQKLMTYLAQQGFRYDDIRSVLEEEGIIGS